MDRIYLDYNAGAPVRPKAKDALVAALVLPGNASSVHGFGRAARARLEEARAVVANAAGFAAGDVVFTSGGTEANHLALRGVAAACVLISAIEHDSVLKTVPDARCLPVLPSGLLDLEAAERIIAAAPAPALVSVMWVNNETGVIQPVAEILQICRAHRALLHVDAAQALGKVALDVPVDLLTLSSPKIGGAPGTGALCVRDAVPLTAQLVGGGQEHGRRSGTENGPGIAAFATAITAALAELPEFQRRAIWRTAFEQRLLAVPGTRIIGSGAPRVANTTCLVCPGFRSELQLMQLDLRGIAVSSGSACSSGKVARSHVLAAMGVDPDGLDSALRVSFGWDSTEDQLNFCAEIWTQAAISATRKALGA